MSIRRSVASALVVTMIVLPVAGLGETSPPLPPLLQESESLAAGLVPISAATDALLSDAISKANKAMEDRLNQLQGIINSTIFSLQQAVSHEIEVANAEAAAQVRALNVFATDLTRRYEVLIGKTLDQVQALLNESTDKIAAGLGNAIAQLDFLNTTPVVNVPSTGFRMLLDTGVGTELFVTGVGLAKCGSPPDVTLIPEGKPADAISVQVASASLPLVKLILPNDKLRPGKYSLAFTFRNGSVLPSCIWATHVEQSFPLEVCAPPVVQVKLKLWLEGLGWETRETQLKTGNLGEAHEIFGIQCPRGNGNVHGRIDASATAGWELYERPDWNSQAILCIVNAQNGYAQSSAQRDHYDTYVDGRNGDAHLNMTCTVAERRRVPRAEANPCGVPWTKTVTLNGKTLWTAEVIESTLDGSCDANQVLRARVGASDGISSDAGTGRIGFLLDRQVTWEIDGGLVKLESAPKCERRVFGTARAH